MSRFYFNGSDSESGDDDALPLPQPLARSAFLTPDFSPTEFLSSLRNRHQTLEDLRSELRTRSQDLNKELLDLVNDDYQDFLGLGASLTGGDEKVEEVRLGLLGFRREVDGLRGLVTERKQEIEQLLAERRKVADEVRIGKLLLELDAQLDELESSLRISSRDRSAPAYDEDFEISDTDDSEDESSHGMISVATLQRRVQQLVTVKRLTRRLDPTHPFLKAQEERIQKIQQTLLLDLKSALNEVSSTGRGSTNGHLKILALYRALEKPGEAVAAIKERKSKLK